MTFRSKSVLPAREWRQVRIHPDDAAEVTRLATRLGLAFPAAMRQVLRAGLGKASVLAPTGAKGETKGNYGKVS